MNRLILSLGTAAVMAAFAGAAEKLTVPVGGNKSVTLDFEAAGFKLMPANTDVAKVSLIEEPGGKTRVRVDGAKVGDCEVVVNNAAGGDSAAISVEVVANDVDGIYRSLRAMLDTRGVLLDVAKARNTVIVTGTIDNRSDWGKLKEVLALQEFKGKVESMVEFRVDPKVIAGLRAQFEKAGFKLAPEGQPYDDGELSLTYEHNVVTVAGTVFSEAERAKITTILNGHKTWLEVVESPTANPDTPIAQGVVSVGLDDALVELTVALVAYSEATMKNFGNQKAGLSLNAPVNLFYNLVNGKFDRAAGVGLGLDAMLEFTEGETFSRDVERASLRFKCNAADEAKIEFGGTMKVKMKTTDKEGNPVESFEDMEYGFFITKKEGRRITADTVEMKLNIKQMLEPIFLPDGSFDLKRNEYNEPVSCKIGHTTKVGDHQKTITWKNTPTGTPFLRNVPILSWFVSKEGFRDEDKKLMILVSVRLVKPGEEPEAPLKEMKDITPIIEIPSDEIGKKEKTTYWLLPWTW